MTDDIEEQTVSGLTIRIDRTRCIGTGNCVAVAPEVLELGSDQIVTFVNEPEDIDRERLIEACAVCPVDALFAIDEDGNQIVP
jgi:ferredoxin